MSFQSDTTSASSVGIADRLPKSSALRPTWASQLSPRLRDKFNALSYSQQHRNNHTHKTPRSSSSAYTSSYESSVRWASSYSPTVSPASSNNSLASSYRSAYVTKPSPSDRKRSAAARSHHRATSSTFQITHTPDRPNRIISAEEIPSDEECKAFLIALHKKHKVHHDDYQSDEDEYGEEEEQEQEQEEKELDVEKEAPFSASADTVVVDITPPDRVSSGLVDITAPSGPVRLEHFPQFVATGQSEVPLDHDLANDNNNNISDSTPAAIRPLPPIPPPIPETTVVVDNRAYSPVPQVEFARTVSTRLTSPRIVQVRRPSESSGGSPPGPDACVRALRQRRLGSAAPLSLDTDTLHRLASGILPPLDPEAAATNANPAGKDYRYCPTFEDEDDEEDVLYDLDQAETYNPAVPSPIIVFPHATPSLPSLSPSSLRKSTFTCYSPSPSSPSFSGLLHPLTSHPVHPLCRLCGTPASPSLVERGLCILCEGDFVVPDDVFVSPRRDTFVLQRAPTRSPAKVANTRYGIGGRRSPATVRVSSEVALLVDSADSFQQDDDDDRVELERLEPPSIQDQRLSPSRSEKRPGRDKMARRKSVFQHPVRTHSITLASMPKRTMSSTTLVGNSRNKYKFRASRLPVRAGSAPPLPAVGHKARQQAAVAAAAAATVAAVAAAKVPKPKIPKDEEVAPPALTLPVVKEEQKTKTPKTTPTLVTTKPAPITGTATATETATQALSDFIATSSVDRDALPAPLKPLPRDRPDRRAEPKEANTNGFLDGLGIYQYGPRDVSSVATADSGATFEIWQSGDEDETDAAAKPDGASTSAGLGVYDGWADYYFDENIFSGTTAATATAAANTSSNARSTYWPMPHDVVPNAAAAENHDENTPTGTRLHRSTFGSRGGIMGIKSAWDDDDDDDEEDEGASRAGSERWMGSQGSESPSGGDFYHAF